MTEPTVASAGTSTSPIRVDGSNFGSSPAASGQQAASASRASVSGILGLVWSGRFLLPLVLLYAPAHVTPLRVIFIWLVEGEEQKWTLEDISIKQRPEFSQN